MVLNPFEFVAVRFVVQVVEFDADAREHDPAESEPWCVLARNRSVGNPAASGGATNPANQRENLAFTLPQVPEIAPTGCETEASH